MAGVEGLEPTTLGLEIRCSIHLSYTPALREHDSGAFGGKSNAPTLNRNLHAVKSRELG